MTNNDDARRAANVELAEKLMSKFGVDTAFWWPNLHDDLVLEFPTGGTVGLYERVVGKAKSQAHLGMVDEMLPGWHASNIKVRPMLDPDLVLIEYEGACDSPNGPYRQHYFTLMTFKDGKLINFREHFDTAMFERCFGSAAARQATIGSAA
ncbi:MAG: nuclear transport factor 2 family protein [Sphingomonadaceae bacterium]